MKSKALKIYALLAFVIALAAGSAQAQSNIPQRAHIPFAFIVGQRTLPAGEYTIKRVNPASDKAVLLMTSADGRESVMVQTLAVESGNTEQTARLVFNRYEEQHFLSQVWMAADSTGLGVRTSGRERELARNRNAMERETVALVSHR